MALMGRCKGRYRPLQQGRFGCTNRRCPQLSRRQMQARPVLEREIPLQRLVNLHRWVFSRPSSTTQRLAAVGLLFLCDWYPGEREGEGKQGVSLRNTIRKSYQQLPCALLAWPAKGELQLAPRGPLLQGRCGAMLRGAPSRDGSYLVDPASSHMLVSKIKPCMSKYKLYTVKLRMAH